MPQFNGDLAAYLSSHLQYNIAPEEDINTHVIVQFIIRKDGRVDSVKIIMSGGTSLDTAAVKLVKNMPRWIPGRQNGKPVAVRFTLPINIELE